MSLADEWDSIPAAAAPAKASLADEWDAVKPDPHAGITPKGEGTGVFGQTYGRTMAPAQLVVNQATALGKSILGGWRGLAALASGAGLDEAARQVENPELAGGARAATYEPPAGTPGAHVVDVANSAANPMTWPGIVAHKAGDLTMEATGSPAAATAVETGLNAAPLLLGAKRGTAPARVEPKLVGSSSIADAKPAAAPALTEAENLEIPTVLRRGKVAVAYTTDQPAPSTAPKPELKLVPNEPTPGRKATFDQTPPEAAAAEAEANAPKFAEADERVPAGQTLPAEEQARRAAVLSRIGLDQARVSSLSGDGTAASTDFQMSRLENEPGRLMKTQLDNERAALTNHAEQIVRDTGGTLGTDGQTLEARGHTILQPLEAFKDWFADQTNNLYATARARMGDQPVALDGLASTLRQDSAFAQEGAANLRKGIAARMKELGIQQTDDGQIIANAAKAEELRKYIGGQWAPGMTDLVRNLKETIDNDVTSSAGKDVFQEARGLHAMKQAIFSDPKGLSSILDSEGINRAIPIERIPDKLAAMPNAQFAHIVQTLQHVPPELQPQAAAALSEIKAHFANRMMDAGASRVGQWGARDVTAYLKKNAAKMTQVFSPEEMARIQDLNDAGHILAQDRTYPGAAVQTHNLAQRAVLTALPKIGAASGGVVGALFGAPGTGALVGEGAGSAVAGKLAERSAVKATEKRFTKLGDFPR